MPGSGHKSVAADVPRADRLEQLLLAAQQQILGLDFHDVPARIASLHLGAQDPDASVPTVLAKRNTGCGGKRPEVGLLFSLLRRASPADHCERTRGLALTASGGQHQY